MLNRVVISGKDDEEFRSSVIIGAAISKTNKIAATIHVSEPNKMFEEGINFMVADDEFVFKLSFDDVMSYVLENRDKILERVMEENYEHIS